MHEKVKIKGVNPAMKRMKKETLLTVKKKKKKKKKKGYCGNLGAAPASVLPLPTGTCTPKPHLLLKCSCICW